MPLCFEDTFRVLQFECDAWDNMTPGAVLRRVQDIGMMQTLSLGWDENFYRDNHFVFLVSKISLEVNQMPKFGQQVFMEARGYGIMRAMYHRVTTLYSKRGDKLCEADTRWLLYDTKNRRILRHVPPVLAETVQEKVPKEQHSMVLLKPDQPLRSLSETQASYTMCDRNGHINNTQYADLICNHLPLEQMHGNPPSKMLLFFHNEIRMGQNFAFAGAPVDDNSYYFVAQAGKKHNFEGYAGF